MKPFFATITIKKNKGNDITVYFISKNFSSEKDFDSPRYTVTAQAIQEHLLGLIARLPIKDILLTEEA